MKQKACQNPNPFLTYERGLLWFTQKTTGGYTLTHGEKTTKHDKNQLQDLPIKP